MLKNASKCAGDAVGTGCAEYWARAERFGSKTATEVVDDANDAKFESHEKA